MIDKVSSASVKEILLQRLDEQGFKLDECKVKTAQNAFSEQVMVNAGKLVGEEMIRIKGSAQFTERDLQNSGRYEEQIRLLADKVKRKFEDLIVRTVEVSGTQLRFCKSDGGWAKCDICNEKVELGEILEPPMWMGVDDGPPAGTPTLSSTSDVIRDDKAALFAKLALFGAVRRRCTCGFGKGNPWTKRLKS